MAKLSFIFVLISILTFAFQPINVAAGPFAYAACQTACNLGWASCYASAGLVAGKCEVILDNRNWTIHKVAADIVYVPVHELLNKFIVF